MKKKLANITEGIKIFLASNVLNDSELKFEMDVYDPNNILFLKIHIHLCKLIEVTIAKETVIVTVH